MYITKRSAKVLTRELNQLAAVERPRVVQEVADAAAQGDRSENAEYIYGKRRLREIDRRINSLSKRLDSSTVVSSADRPANPERVFFGASVRVAPEDKEPTCYQLVGPDEAEPSLGRLSYQSPLGRALMGARLGDVVTVARPAGEVEVEVLSIDFGDVD